MDQVFFRENLKIEEIEIKLNFLNYSELRNNL